MKKLNKLTDQQALREIFEDVYSWFAAGIQQDKMLIPMINNQLQTAFTRYTITKDILRQFRKLFENIEVIDIYTDYISIDSAYCLADNLGPAYIVFPGLNIRLIHDRPLPYPLDPDGSTQF